MAAPHHTTRDKVEKSLYEAMPPIVSREHAEKLTGGMITAVRLRDLDSAGEGPGTKISMNGRRVGYLKDEFIPWFMGRVKVQDKGL